MPQAKQEGQRRSVFIPQKLWAKILKGSDRRGMLIYTYICSLLEAGLAAEETNGK